jgi:hypothetical protein
MKRILILLLTIMLLSACAGSLPEWYSNREDYFSEDEYIVSKGWGVTPDKAIEQAAINMSQIFGTRISVEKNVLERYESISNAKDFDEYMYEFSQETATLIADHHLVNILFVEPTWVKKSKAYYTLGYIKRTETALILMDRMKREQENVEYFVRMAEGSMDPIEKYHYYCSAWLTAGQNKMMQEQLDLLVPGLEIKPIYSFEELGSLKEIAGNQLRFYINVQGDSNNRTKQALRKAVNEAGFPVLDNTGLLRIFADVKIKELDIDQKPLVFVSWELQIKLVDWQDQTIISMMKEGKEGSTNEDNARMHAYESIQKYIDEEFEQKLIEFFDILEIDR